LKPSEATYVVVIRSLLQQLNSLSSSNDNEKQVEKELCLKRTNCRLLEIYRRMRNEHIVPRSMNVYFWRKLLVSIARAGGFPDDLELLAADMQSLGISIDQKTILQLREALFRLQKPQLLETICKYFP